MTKNIIFEIGEVLIKWDQVRVIKETFPKEDSIAIMGDLFASHSEFEWLKGELEYKKVLGDLVPKLQDKYTSLNFTYESIYYLIKKIKGTLEPV